MCGTEDVILCRLALLLPPSLLTICLLLQAVPRSESSTEDVVLCSLQLLLPASLSLSRRRGRILATPTLLCLCLQCTQPACFGLGGGCLAA